MDDMSMADGQMADDQMSMDSSDLPMMNSEGMMQIASVQGTVVAIDAEAGTITIDHGPVPELDWPAMTMGFTATEELQASVATDDAVTFTFQQTEGGYEIVSVEKE